MKSDEVWYAQGGFYIPQLQLEVLGILNAMELACKSRFSFMMNVNNRVVRILFLR